MTRHPAPRPRFRLLLSALLAVAAALPARAQTVQGHAVDRETQQPIVNAAMALVDSAGEVVASGHSGEDGAFRLTAPQPGEYRLTASRIGYRSMLSAVVALAEGQVVEAQARITPRPVTLDTATVAIAAEAGITGSVLEQDSDRPVPGATVTLLDRRGLRVGRAVADGDGRFHLRVPNPGAHQLRTERVGFQPSTSPSLMVMPDDTLRVELRMSSSTLVLAPLTVVASSRRLMRDDQMAEFDWRRQNKPFGRFLGPEEIRRMNPFFATDALRQVPFVQVHAQRWDRTVTLRGRRGGRCVPTVYVDGHYVAMGGDSQLDDWVRGTALAGVEVYENAIHAPPEFAPRSNAYDCGVVVLWTRPPGEEA